MGVLAEVIRSPALRRLHLAWLATSVGVWGGSLALAVYAYDAGGPVAVGVLALCRTLPGALAAPFLSLAADRSSRRTILLVVTVAQAAILAATAAAVGAGVPLAAVDGLACLFAVVNPAFRPAQTALFARLARTPGELCAANVAASMVSNLGFVVGGVAAGVLLRATSPAVTLGVLAGAFAAALVPLARVPADPRPEPEPGAHPARELAEGFRTVAGDRQLREPAAMEGALGLVDGAMDVLVVVAALGFLHLGDAGAGYLNGAWGVGSIVGGPAVLALLHRGRLTWGLTLGAVLVGGSIALVGLVPVVAVAVAGMVLFGAGFTVADVVAESLLQRAAPDHVLARVFGVVEALSVAMAAAGSLGAGLLADAVGERWALAAVAVLLPAVVLLRRRRLARLESSAPVSARDYALVRGHPIFAPLPVAATERLARSLEELHPAEGSAVITQGDHGEHFYLVVAGELDVVGDGVFRRTLGPGEGFGEIALLRDVPRTATVTAGPGTVLLAMRRDLFLGVVTGQARSARAAAALADERTAADGAGTSSG